MLKLFHRKKFGPAARIAAMALAGALIAIPGTSFAASDHESAPSPQAKAAVQRLAGHALRILHDSTLDTQGRHRALATMLHGGLDIPTLADFVMGRHGERLSPGDRARFRDAFGDYVVDTYARMLARQAIADITVTDSREVTETTAAVSTRVVREEGDDTTWIWRLHERGGTYRIVDLQSHGVSLAVTYRSQLGRALSDGAVDEVVERLREQTAMGAPMGFERVALIQLLRDFGGGRLALTSR